MTYKELAEAILKLPEEQQAQKAYFVGGSGHCEESDVFEVKTVKLADRLFIDDPAWNIPGRGRKMPKPSLMVMDDH